MNVIPWWVRERVITATPPTTKRLTPQALLNALLMADPVAEAGTPKPLPSSIMMLAQYVFVEDFEGSACRSPYYASIDVDFTNKTVKYYGYAVSELFLCPASDSELKCDAPVMASLTNHLSKALGQGFGEVVRAQGLMAYSLGDTSIAMVATRLRVAGPAPGEAPPSEGVGELTIRGGGGSVYVSLEGGKAVLVQYSSTSRKVVQSAEVGPAPTGTYVALALIITNEGGTNKVYATTLNDSGKVTGLAEADLQVIRLPAQLSTYAAPFMKYAGRADYVMASLVPQQPTARGGGTITA